MSNQSAMSKIFTDISYLRIFYFTEIITLLGCLLVSKWRYMNLKPDVSYWNNLLILKKCHILQFSKLSTSHNAATQQQ